MIDYCFIILVIYYIYIEAYIFFYLYGFHRRRLQKKSNQVVTANKCNFSNYNFLCMYSRSSHRCPTRLTIGVVQHINYEPLLNSV